MTLPVELRTLIESQRRLIAVRTVADGPGHQQLARLETEQLRQGLRVARVAERVGFGGFGPDDDVRPPLRGPDGQLDMFAEILGVAIRDPFLTLGDAWLHQPEFQIGNGRHRSRRQPHRSEDGGDRHDREACNGGAGRFVRLGISAAQQGGQCRCENRQDRNTVDPEMGGGLDEPRKFGPGVAGQIPGESG